MMPDKTPVPPKSPPSCQKAQPPERLRSDGALAPERLAQCRSSGVLLAYDPVQIGWVLASAVDDIDEHERSDAARLLQAMRGRFERLAGPMLTDWVAGRISPDAIESQLWGIAERVVGEYRTHSAATNDVQREAQSELQAAAAHLIHRRVIGAAELTAIAGRCESLAGRYQLREWRAEDAPRYVELLDNPRVWEHLPQDQPRPLTHETARALIELSSTASHHEVRAIEREGEVVGQVRLEFARGGRVALQREAEISYWLGEEYWGRSIMSDVVLLYTRSSFQAHDLDSIFARIREENTASARLAEKCRYRYEGRLQAELDGQPGMRRHRVFRGDYLESSPRQLRRVTSRGVRARGATLPA